MTWIDAPRENARQWMTRFIFTERQQYIAKSAEEHYKFKIQPLRQDLSPFPIVQYFTDKYEVNHIITLADPQLVDIHYNNLGRPSYQRNPLLPGTRLRLRRFENEVIYYNPQIKIFSRNSQRA